MKKKIFRERYSRLLTPIEEEIEKMIKEVETYDELVEEPASVVVKKEPVKRGRKSVKSSK